MKGFNEWFNEENRQLDEGYWSPVREGGKQALEAAFKAGMLAAADIAERMYFTHTPDDGVISGEGVADEIRKRANDI